LWCWIDMQGDECSRDGDRARGRLMYKTPNTRPVPYIRRTLARGGGTKTDQGFYSLMVAPPAVPRNVEGAELRAALQEARCRARPLQNLTPSL